MPCLQSLSVRKFTEIVLIFICRYKIYNVSFIFQLQTYAVDLCRSFCELLKDITTEGQVQALKVEYRENVKYLDLQL